MVHERSILRGGTDYTGVSLQDIYEHLKDWRDSTIRTIKVLQSHRIKLIQNKGKIDRYINTLYFVDLSLDLFNRFLSDFNRLLKEIPTGVTISHIEIISQIFSRSEFHDKSCVDFKNDHIERELKDETMRTLLDGIYATARDEIINYSDLSNVEARMRTFIGTKMEDKSQRITIDDTEAIQLKPNIFGIGLDLNYIIKRVKSLFIGKKS